MLLLSPFTWLFYIPLVCITANEIRQEIDVQKHILISKCNAWKANSMQISDKRGDKKPCTLFFFFFLLFHERRINKSKLSHNVRLMWKRNKKATALYTVVHHGLYTAISVAKLWIKVQKADHQEHRQKAWPCTSNTIQQFIIYLGKNGNAAVSTTLTQHRCHK